MRSNSRKTRFQTLIRIPTFCGFMLFVLLLNPNVQASQNPEKPPNPISFEPKLVTLKVSASQYPNELFISGTGYQDASNRTEALQSSPSSPPLNKFGNQLLSNFRNVFSLDNLKPFIIGSAATAGSIPFDDDLKDYFGEERRAEPLGEVGSIIGHPLVLGASAGSALLWSYNTSNDRFRSMSFSLTQALILDYTMTAAVKLVFHRERPDSSGILSFPSGHSSGIFATATVISHYYKKTAIPAYATAALVAFSRIEKNKHHLSDVVFGAMLGVISARTAIRGTNTFWGEKITWMPFALPEGGFAVFVSLTPD